MPSTAARVMVMSMLCGALSVAGCADEERGVAAADSPSTKGAPSSGSSTAKRSTTAAAAIDIEKETDLLSWGAGAFAVRVTPPADFGIAQIAIDGDPRTREIGIPRRQPLPYELVIEMPALTTFTAFAVPKLNEFGPAKGRHIKTVEIAGSTTSADEGFTPLARLVIEIDKNAAQIFPVQTPRPVGWLKVRFLDRYTAPKADYEPYLFSELMGFGKQDRILRTPSTFEGVWKTRGGLTELHQDALSISGCQVSGGHTVPVTGAVVDGLAKVRLDPDGPNGGSPALLSVAQDQALVGAIFTKGMTWIYAERMPLGTTTPCSAKKAGNPVEEALKKGKTAVVYGIQFAVDSAELHVNAEHSLQQLLAALKSDSKLAVIVEGHTDSDASEEHNLALSQQRADSVVAWLKNHGISADRLEAVGRGESSPIAPNDTSAGRALNRRVEIKPRTES